MSGKFILKNNIRMKETFEYNIISIRDPYTQYQELMRLGSMGWEVACSIPNYIILKRNLKNKPEEDII